MKKISTLKRAFISSALSGLILFSGFNANSQCTTLAVSNCPPTTETFTSNSFSEGPGFQYDANVGAYVSSSGNVTTMVVTSYRMQVVGNIITVGGQITRDANRISSGRIDVLENGSVICSFQASLNSEGKICAQVNGLNEKVVQFRFTFTRSSNGGTITFDNFGIDPTQTTLPVNFTSFNAKKEGAATKLTWNVAQQDNVSHYDIERSSNGTVFTKIGEVKASDVTTYNFTDAQPVQGTVYYRIKNVDNDGKFKYSTVVSLKNGTAAIVLKAFPLPARNSVTVQHNTAAPQAQIRISNADGRLLKMVRPAAGTMQTSVDLTALTPGLYILTFDNGNGNIETLKLVKQ